MVTPCFRPHPPHSNPLRRCFKPSGRLQLKHGSPTTPSPEVENDSPTLCSLRCIVALFTSRKQLGGAVRISFVLRGIAGIEGSSPKLSRTTARTQRSWIHRESATAVNSPLTISHG